MLMRYPGANDPFGNLRAVSPNQQLSIILSLGRTYG